MALQDPLTGLGNRLLFDDRMAQAIGRAVRTKRTLGVIFCDLDLFKTVNDRTRSTSTPARRHGRRSPPLSLTLATFSGLLAAWLRHTPPLPPDRELVNTSHMMIANPFRGGGVAQLFATHRRWPSGSPGWSRWRATDANCQPEAQERGSSSERGQLR